MYGVIDIIKGSIIEILFITWFSCCSFFSLEPNTVEYVGVGKKGSLSDMVIRQLDTEMVFVKGGEYKMGLNDTDDVEGSDDEKPRHPVYVKSFYISRFEVTQSLWLAVMDTNPSVHKNCSQCPVENINWYQAQEFIKRLNAMTHREYRLPTEAEWEYAARGGRQSKGYKYSGSDSAAEVGWYEDNGSITSHPVGMKKPNELRLYDMSGNVSEWCSDWYDEAYYKKQISKYPQGQTEGTFKVLRGGHWLSLVDGCRSTTRGRTPPWLKDRFTGLRIVRDYKWWNFIIN